MKERRWIGFVLVFVLLFEMVQPREKNLPPRSVFSFLFFSFSLLLSSSSLLSFQSHLSFSLSLFLFQTERTEQISVCLGVMYGIVKVEAIDFFVSYYRKIGVERVRAFLHPQLQPQIGEFESIPNFIGFYF